MTTHHHEDGKLADDHQHDHGDEHQHDHEHDHGGHEAHAHHDMGGVNKMAVSATLHCLTGCAIGEILGLMIGTAIGLGTGWTIVLAVGLAFFFGYLLSTLPLLRSGLALGTTLSVVLAADTLSIATMELVDNLVMALIPGAMDAGLVNPIFWVGMMIALSVAFFAAWPVNRYLLQRGKGHALTHDYHGAGDATGARRFIPSFSTGALVATIVAFMVGGLVVSIADEMKTEDSSGSHAARAVVADQARGVGRLGRPETPRA
jgi:hypothetical protein